MSTIIYSLWTKPILEKLQNPKYTLILTKLYLLSFLNTKRFYDGEIHLVTDVYGAELLKEIKYDRIKFFDNSIENVNTKIWTYPKIYALNLYNKPVIHLDGDLILTKPTYAKNILASKYDILCQSLEYGNHYKKFYLEDIQKFMDITGISLEFYFLNYYNIVYNLGIFGFKNIAFKDFFCKSYFNLINQLTPELINKFNTIQKLYEEYGYMSDFKIDFNCFIEQSLLSSLSIINNLYVKCFVPPIKTNYFKDHAIFFHEDSGLKHWAGKEKWKDENIINEIDERLFLIKK